MFTRSISAALAASLPAILIAGAAISEGPVEGTAGLELETVPLRFGSISIYSENDKYFAGTDRNYTNGFKLSVLSRDLLSLETTKLTGPLRLVTDQAGRVLDAGAEAKIGFALGQSIFTPTNTADPAYIPGDRPYAGWLYLGAAFHNYRPEGSPTAGPERRRFARLDVFEINLGVVGPSALGEDVQNWFHELIETEESFGWAHQIHDEPGLNLIFERKWRWSTERARDGWGGDFISHAGVSLGNVYTYVNAGFELRAGYRLPADFGTSLIRPSGDTNAPRSSFNAFVFIGAAARGVARDITLDGNTFRDSPSIGRKAFVHDIMGGFGVGWRRAQFTYTQARRSVEFDGQNDPQDFGSIAFALFF